MSNITQNDRGKNEKFLLYNLFGLRPTAVTFQFTIDQLKDIMKTIIDNEINGCQYLTIDQEPDPNSAIPKNRLIAHAWFKKNSDHFYNKSTENSLLNRAIPQISDKMENFIRKFGYCEADNSKDGSGKVQLNKVLGRNVNNEIKDNLICIKLSFMPFFIIIFDGTGASFKNDYPKLNPPKIKISRKMIEDPTSGKYKRIIGVRVSKYIETAMNDRSVPRPSRSGKF